MKIIKKIRKKRRKLIRRFFKSPIKKRLAQYSKTHPRFRKCWKKILYTKRRIYYWWRGLGVTPDEKTVVFNSFNGKTYGCSPKAVYEYMLTQDEFKDWTFIWAFKNAKKHRFLEENPNTIVVKQTARVYEKKLIRAKYWITNYRVPDHVWPKKDQVYVQCWHGTPLKRLGYDLETSENAIDSIADIRKKYAMDAEKFNYILSPSGFASEKFTSAWNLKETKMEDKVMEIGYPRNDILYADNKEEIAAEVKKELGIPEGKRVILYAPTWRDNQFYDRGKYKFTLALDLGRLQKEFGEDSVVLLRTHYYIADILDLTEYEGFVYNGSQYEDVSRLYLASDICITDYSSVFFDFANLKRPILFYAYDFDEYADEIRGMYMDMEKELPGPILRTNDAVVDALHHMDAIEETYKERYEEFYERFCSVDDGHASERVIEKVFGERENGTLDTEQ